MTKRTRSFLARFDMFHLFLAWVFGLEKTHRLVALTFSSTESCQPRLLFLGFLKGIGNIKFHAHFNRVKLLTIIEDHMKRILENFKNFIRVKVYRNKPLVSDESIFGSLYE